MLTTLPEELLHPIVKYIAYKPHLPHERSKFRRVSGELRSLSVVDHRLRRICLPFLFANICIGTKIGAERLQNSCSYNRVLKLDRRAFRYGEMLKMIWQTLPSLKHLLTVDLEEFDVINITFLKAILDHPSVSSVLVRTPNDYLLDRFLPLDMSKFVFFDGDRRSTLETWLAQGARLLSLNVVDHEQLDEEFGLRTFQGLEVLNLFVHYCPVSFSWLPKFSSTHPHLRRLWINNRTRWDFFALSFISSLFEDSRNTRSYSISRVGLGRVTSGSQEWHVTGLTIVSTSSLKESCTLIASSFPDLELLELDLSVHETYSFDDILSALAPFSSLRTLSLSCVFGTLLFDKNGQPNHLIHEYDCIQVLARRVEDAVLSYISRLTQILTGLESCFISEYGQVDKDGIEGTWSLNGWLRVHNSRNIDREELRVYAGGNLISLHK
ncbi:hypothetical protein BDP27DRAFT_1516937 [Rhodocollybia butyracea]|uniref:F-box domain-containing protein n=1 Tax=Rhodocollybia butyracea TaxID=206335 RepID=A0A9P5TXU2_9AGAR|nr:hypothetical protein BDP27DRAFT_1516937 [Rhodocollybia butyracea]